MGELLEFEKILRLGFGELGIELSPEAVSRCRLYYEELAERNRVMNLTAIAGEEDTARLHFLDSAALLAVRSFRGRRVIDIGTGAGFPGLALKIAEPSAELVLMDSQRKRVEFLSGLCVGLGFPDVRCVHSRAEDMRDGFREGFDIAVSRAVARLNALCELCMPYVAPGGEFIAMKGPDCAEEVREAENAVRTLGGEVEETRTYNIPGTEIKHSAVIIKKVRETPGKYPRRFSKIQKEPL